MLELASNFQAFGKEVFFPVVKMDIVTLVGPEKETLTRRAHVLLCCVPKVI